MFSNMTPEFLDQHYDLSRIKNNAIYNGLKMRITDVNRKDGEMMSRKEMIKMCNGFLTELQNKYKASTMTLKVVWTGAWSIMSWDKRISIVTVISNDKTSPWNIS